MSELERLVASTREQLGQRRREMPLEQLERAAAERGGSVGDAFKAALSRPGLSLIAEHKRSSPSAGTIREGTSVQDVVRAYERGGAAALSILTEPTSFGGALEDIASAKAVVDLPVLRKDFIVDRYQLLESLAAGADAVLLIVAALSQQELSSLLGEATSLGLAALVEVHDEPEIERAIDAGAELVGINNRDLETLEVDPGRTFELLPQLPPGCIVVAESGFTRREQLDSLAEAGVDAVLIGEALMRAADLELAVRTMCE